MRGVRHLSVNDFPQCPQTKIFNGDCDTRAQPSLDVGAKVSHFVNAASVFITCGPGVHFNSDIFDSDIDIFGSDIDIFGSDIDIFSSDIDIFDSDIHFHIYFNPDVFYQQRSSCVVYNSAGTRADLIVRAAVWSAAFSSGHAPEMVVVDRVSRAESPLPRLVPQTYAMQRTETTMGTTAGVQTR